MDNDFKCYIITGTSGSGKTTALKAFEDMDFYCMDNIPTIMIPNVIKILKEKTKIKKIAIGVDIREKVFLNSFNDVFNILKKDYKFIEIIFLFADKNVILKRYKETRRVHPLMKDDLLKAIQEEEKTLEPIKKNANIFIDTTNFNVHDLKKFIYENFGEETLPELKINIVSFGFKNGILTEGDLIFDVRFIPNPFFIEELKNRNGNDKDVFQYVFGFNQTIEFYEKIVDLLKFLIPLYKKEGKRFLIVGIGCTGGKHRSVAIANKLFDDLKKLYNVSLKHRDL